jgi:hypothetical protein
VQLLRDLAIHETEGEEPQDLGFTFAQDGVLRTHRGQACKGVLPAASVDTTDRSS